MTIYQITDMISRIPEGGILTNLSRFDPLFLQSLVDISRAFWIQDTYRKDSNLPAVCYQKFYPEYSRELQPPKGCYKKFLMPDIIRLDENSDGIRYVGSDDYNGSVTNAFDRIESRAWLATYGAHPVMNPNNDRTFSFLYDASAGTLEFRGEKASMTRTPLIECLFMHPLQIPTFNKEVDDYPIPLDGIYAIEKMIFQSDTRIVDATKPKVAFEQSNTMIKK